MAAFHSIIYGRFWVITKGLLFRLQEEHRHHHQLELLKIKKSR
jgi:hypothetical protein